MRKMTDGNAVITVLEWIQTSGNFWEYYVIEKWNNQNCAYCLVDGDFQEIGLVSLDEIKPYINCRTKDLSRLQPPSGWSWLE